jgi:hypothetical protein
MFPRCTAAVLALAASALAPVGAQSIRIGAPADSSSTDRDLLIMQEVNATTGQAYGTAASLLIAEVRQRLAGTASVALVTPALYSAAVTPEAVPAGRTGASRRLRVAEASVNAFEVLGIRPAVGRGFVPEDADGTARIAVLAAGAWQRFYGSSPEVIGKLLWQRGRANAAEPILIVGVLRPGTLTSTPELDPDIDAIVFTPAAFKAPSREERWFAPIVRLSPGARLQDVQALIDEAVDSVKRGAGSGIVPAEHRLGLFSLRRPPRASVGS